MQTNGSTTQMLLGISDYELISSEQAASGGRIYKILHLQYSGEIPNTCPACGAKLYKHTSKRIKITDTPRGGEPVLWEVEIVRRRCKNQECKYMWKSSISGVNSKRLVTDRAILDITQKSLSTTFANVADEFMLSKPTVSNIFQDFMAENEERLRFKTPTFLGIDEKKIKKLGEITVITDLEHKTLFDMLQGRNQKTLTEYFMNLPGREDVLWVCTDMYRPFERSIAEAMPNARWVIDHFHVVMKANEAVDAVRRIIQASMTKKARIKTKKGLAYTLKTRARDLTADEASKIRSCRSDPVLRPLAIAFDLKEDFFNIYDENKDSKDKAQEAFRQWEESLPEDELYNKFRELAKTVHNFYEQIFNYWDCPTAISNGFTECVNRIIAENNTRGRGYSFEVLRGRTLYRKTNLKNALVSGILIGPDIPKSQPVFYFEGKEADDDEDDEDDWLDFDPETGEILESDS